MRWYFRLQRGGQIALCFLFFGLAVLCLCLFALEIVPALLWPGIAFVLLCLVSIFLYTRAENYRRGAAKNADPSPLPTEQLRLRAEQRAAAIIATGERAAVEERLQAIERDLLPDEMLEAAKRENNVPVLREQYELRMEKRALLRHLME